MSLDVSFVLNSGHSCRGLKGLALAHISTHQLRNGVEIAALIPGWVRREDPPHSGGQSAASWEERGFDGPAADSGLPSVVPVFTRHIPTLQRAVYLVDFITCAWGHWMLHGVSGSSWNQNSALKQRRDQKDEQEHAELQVFVDFAPNSIAAINRLSHITAAAYISLKLHILPRQTCQDSQIFPWGKYTVFHLSHLLSIPPSLGH